jgi:hypothetical protein
MLRHFIDELRHGLGRIRTLADLHDLRRVLELMREAFDLLRQRGGEHQRLPFARQLLDDAADVRQEAHVEHAVGFIEHEVFELGEIGAALAHQIEQTARAGDDDVAAGTQRVLLRLFADAAIHLGDLQRQMPRIG